MLTGRVMKYPEVEIDMLALSTTRRSAPLRGEVQRKGSHEGYPEVEVGKPTQVSRFSRWASRCRLHVRLRLVGLPLCTSLTTALPGPRSVVTAQPLGEEAVRVVVTRLAGEELIGRSVSG